MFSVSDIKEETYPAAYRRGKELYEAGGVWDFSYDIYLEREQTMAEVSAKVRGIDQPYYPVTVVVDEAFATVSNAKCSCEAFYNYDRMCKHRRRIFCRRRTVSLILPRVMGRMRKSRWMSI